MIAQKPKGARLTWVLIALGIYNFALPSMKRD